MVCKKTHRAEAIKIERVRSWKLSDKTLQDQDAKAYQGMLIETRMSEYWL